MTEKPVETLTFEQAAAEMEALVLRLESGDLPLADALAAYQRGAALMRHAQSILNQVQTEIDVIEAGTTTTLERSTLVAQVKDQ
jgi:exodeoxyribonuclease VII small subunit